MNEIKVLDKGFIRLVDKMGSDSRIVDAARVSYQKGTKAVQDDRNLIRYLVRNKHTSPLEMVILTFHVKCPLMVRDQWVRHRSGSFNIVSFRYSEAPDEFYIPEILRGQSKSHNQGSSDEIITQIPLGGPATADSKQYITGITESSYEDYQQLIAAGVSRELARGILGSFLYTEFYWTVNLHNLFHFLKLRLDQHAQLEIRVYAEAILQMLRESEDLKFAVEAFQDYILDAPELSKYEIQALRQLLESQVPGPSKRDARETLQELVNNHPSMSKREKTESKLIKLILD